jgi:hypothetical protein
MPFDCITTSDASCRVFWNAPSLRGRATAAIGNIRCEHDAAGIALLSRAVEELRAEGVEAMLGPMIKNTWHDYRLVEESDGSPAFFLEPVNNPACIKQAFASAGFERVACYMSSRAALDEAVRLSESAPVEGVTVNAWDGKDAEAVLDVIYAISMERFSGNPFFKSIEKTEFCSRYRALLPVVDPRLVFLACDSQGIAGFLFGIPNRLEGPKPASVILKSYAGMRPGIGHLLAGTFHRTARALGFSEVIYALMHVHNPSVQRTTRYGGRTFRRYALMGQILA